MLLGHTGHLYQHAVSGRQHCQRGPGAQGGGGKEGEGCASQPGVVSGHGLLAGHSCGLAEQGTTVCKTSIGIGAVPV